MTICPSHRAKLGIVSSRSCSIRGWVPDQGKWGGQGGGRPGEKGAGGVREAGEEGAGSGILKVAGSGRKREKLLNIAQYFAIEKMQRGGSQKIQGGNRD